MSIFLLVHGGISTGAIWDRVAPALRKAGHQVYTPDLKGMGSRRNELTRDISIDDYIDDVCNVLEKHNLYEVILVGHSLAGLIITAVASKLPNRIAQLVYLDALIPDVGNTVFDLIKPLQVDWLINLANDGGDGWRYNPEQLATKENFPDDEERSWLLARFSPQPLNAQQTPVLFDPKVVDKIPKYYIYCSDDGSYTSDAANKAKFLGWAYDEIKTGHMAMATAPKELISLLLKLV